MGAEALDPAQHRGAGEPVLAQQLDDRLVERLRAVLVGLADEDPQQLALALDLHMVLPTARPANAATRPSVIIPKTLAAVSSQAESSASRTLS